MLNTNRAFIVGLFLTLQWFIATPVLALSDAVKIDIATGQLIAYLEQGNDAAVIAATEKLRTLKVEDSRLDFFDGEALFNMKQFSKAQSALETYVNATGRKAEFYQDAIILLGKLESMFDSTNAQAETNTRKQASLGTFESIANQFAQPEKTTTNEAGLTILVTNESMQSSQGVTGSYESSGSSIVIIQIGDEVNGTYDNGRGKISGTLLAGNVFSGYLIPHEDNPPPKCSKKKQGTKYWQSFHAAFTANGFSGQIRECSIFSDIRPWKATRVKTDNDEAQNKVMDQMLDELLAK